MGDTIPEYQFLVRVFKQNNLTVLAAFSYYYFTTIQLKMLYKKLVLVISYLVIIHFMRLLLFVNYYR